MRKLNAPRGRRSFHLRRGKQLHRALHRARLCGERGEPRHPAARMTNSSPWKRVLRALEVAGSGHRKMWIYVECMLHVMKARLRDSLVPFPFPSRVPFPAEVPFPHSRWQAWE